MVAVNERPTLRAQWRLVMLGLLPSRDLATRGGYPGLETSRTVVLLAVALAVFALWRHWPSGAAFKADDYPAIAHASDWHNVLLDSAQPWYGIDTFRFYRPLMTVSLAVDHALFGLEPLGY
jgi:hypothetical protein